jgi:spore germination protein (amino acid permease)
MKPQRMSKDITLIQYILFINQAQTGIGLLSLPGLLAKSAGTDGWISLLLGYVLAVAASLLIIQVMKKHPDKTIIGLVQHYFGNIVGKGFSFLIAVYMLFFAYNVLEETAMIFKSRLLQQTPVYIFLFLFVIPAYVFASGGIRIMARNAIVVKIVGLFLYALALNTLHDTNWIYLLPILKEGWNPIFEAVKTTIFSFLGFEFAFFLYPYLQKKQHASVGIIIANTLSLLLSFLLQLFVLYSLVQIKLHSIIIPH